MKGIVSNLRENLSQMTQCKSIANKFEAYLTLTDELQGLDLSTLVKFLGSDNSKNVKDFGCFEGCRA